MKSLAEEQLIDRSVNSDDRLAFSELVRRHQSGLRYFLRQLTRWDEALADDLAQDTFIRAYQKLHSYRGEAKFSSWLYRIAYNLFLQHCRKKHINTEELQDHTAEASHTPDDEHIGDDLHRALARAMGRLSIQARSVMHLSLHQQCTQQEISDIMGIPLGTVKTHLSRSRPLLQAQLKAWRE